MNQTMKILDTWSNVANQLRMRDRSVKTLQYGCQMLLGFYANKLTKETHEILTLFRRTASTSRKAFWILKSVNHITSAIHLVQNLLANEFSWQTFFDLLEQIFLASYFVFENFVFFIRVKVLPWNEAETEQWLFQHWFLGDLFGVLSSLVRFCTSWYSIFGQSANLSMECEASALKFRRFYFDLSALIYVSSLLTILFYLFPHVHQFIFLCTVFFLVHDGSPSFR